MADIEQLSRALLAADKAGDTQSAQLLANEIRKLQGSQQQPTPTQEAAPDTNGPMQGFGAAFRSGIDQPLENMAETARAVGADGTAETLSNLTSAPENYESASAKFIEGDEDGSFAYRYLPKAAVEQIGQYAGSLITRAGGAAAGTAVAGPAGGVVGAFAGPFAFEAVQLLGPIANERARNNGRDRPNKDDFIAAAQTAAASGALNALIPGKGGIVKRTAAETATEGAQSVVEQTGSTAGTDVGLQIDPRQAVGEAILGGTAAGGVNVALTTVNSAGDKVFKPKEDLDPETTQAASDVSALLQRVADENGYNLKDIDSSSKKGANQTLEGARDVLLKDLEAQVISLTEKGQIKALSPEDKAFFKQAIRQSKGKVGTTVTKENFDFMQDRFGNTSEGQALLNTFRRSNVLTEVYAGGLKGGVSKFTDMFNPLPSIGRAYNPAGMVAGNINTGAALATGGSSLAAQIPLVVGGRAIDAVTGRRSKVNRFIKKNRGGDGLADPTAPAARDLKQEAKDRRAAEAALKKQQAEQAKLRLQAQYAQQYANGDTPSPDSPNGKMHEGYREINKAAGREAQFQTQKIEAEINAALDAIEAKAQQAGKQDILDDIAEFRSSRQSGRPTRGGVLTSVIGKVKTELADVYANDPQPPQPATPAELQLPLERQLGKNSNQAFMATLRDKMDNDTSILAEDRATLGDAFDSMALNLGRDPVASLEAIVSRATSNLMKPKLAETYLTPYLERVKQQQKAKDVPPVTPAPSSSGPDGPTVAGTVSPSGPVDSGQPPQPALAQQPEPPKVAPLDAEPAKPKKVKKPTTKSVKKAMPEAKAIVEIGRKGSKYENGIQDVDQALEVARLLGITAKMMNSGTALQKATGEDRGTAALHRWSPSMKGFGSLVFFVKPGGSIGGNKITSTTSLMTALHEIGHSLTQGNMDGKGEFGMQRVKNPFSGNLDKVGANSYNASVMKPILEGLGKDHPAIKEIHAFQEVGKAFTEANPSETVPARDIAEILSLLNNAQSAKDVARYKAGMERYRRYTNMASELSVDPMWLYLMNPRLAKELMPINTKLIRDEFKKANNGKIQFYSHPFATILAVVSAMGLLAAGSEEDEEPMMAPGILSA
jgi:hypothetical protein